MFSWLAQPELLSFARSAKLLPRSIYLSHQFSFHNLGEDYHALVRRYQLNISGHKIDVHKEVQVSTYSAGIGESFVEGKPATMGANHDAWGVPTTAAKHQQRLGHPPTMTGTQTLTSALTSTNDTRGQPTTPSGVVMTHGRWLTTGRLLNGNDNAAHDETRRREPMGTDLPSLVSGFSFFFLRLFIDLY
jgi:hypothetical protein